MRKPNWKPVHPTVQSRYESFGWTVNWAAAVPLNKRPLCHIRLSCTTGFARHDEICITATAQNCPSLERIISDVRYRMPSSIPLPYTWNLYHGYIKESTSWPQHTVRVNDTWQSRPLTTYVGAVDGEGTWYLWCHRYQRAQPEPSTVRGGPLSPCRQIWRQRPDS